MNTKENTETLEKITRENGVSLFGVCNIDGLRKTFHESIVEVSNRLSYGISIGVRLSDKIIEDIVDSPTLIYKHHYKSVNYFLDQVAIKISLFIQEKGYSALPIPASQTVDWEKQLGHLSHKTFALKARLGWIGRSGLLVNKIHGARIRFVTVLTDMPLMIREETLSNVGDCGSCVRCIETCPASAITEKEYDMGKCLSLLREFSKRRGIGVYICGVCVKACPIKKIDNC